MFFSSHFDIQSSNYLCNCIFIESTILNLFIMYCITSTSYVLKTLYVLFSKHFCLDNVSILCILSSCCHH